MICASLAEKNPEICCSMLEKVDMAEIRLDLTEFTGDGINRVFSQRKKLIATCRPGNYSDQERMEKLKTAIGAGATYVDIEYEAPAEYRNLLIAYAHSHQCDVIISYHNFDSTPELPELEEIMHNCFQKGGDLAKIATHIKVNRDNSKILSLYKAPGRLIAIGMGELGKISRIVAPFLGAEFTYASPDGGKDTAPGQISYSRLDKFIREIQKI
jgi:3-dehydroquinate dehydratase-1